MSYDFTTLITVLVGGSVTVVAGALTIFVLFSEPNLFEENSFRIMASSSSSSPYYAEVLVFQVLTYFCVVLAFVFGFAQQRRHDAAIVAQACAGLALAVLGIVVARAHVSALDYTRANDDPALEALVRAHVRMYIGAAGMTVAVVQFSLVAMFSRASEHLEGEYAKRWKLDRWLVARLIAASDGTFPEERLRSVEMRALGAGRGGERARSRALEAEMQAILDHRVVVRLRDK